MSCQLPVVSCQLPLVSCCKEPVVISRRGKRIPHLTDNWQLATGNS